MHTRVNKDICTGCGKCVRACTKALISMQNGKAYIDEDECFECGHCAALCPFDAIEYDWKKRKLAKKLQCPALKQ